MTIRFDRKLADARPFERTAFAAIERVLFDVLSNDFEVFESAKANTFVSSHALAGGSEERDFSTLFRSELAGGSGSTYVFILAMRMADTGAHVYGLHFDTNESGSVYLSEPNTETGYSIVGAKQGDEIQEYEFVASISGYWKSSAE